VPERCVVLLGSNVRPVASLAAAVAELARVERVVAVSSVWRSAAVGAAGTPDFLNAAVALETARTPRGLRDDVLRPIEARLGRTRGADPNAPRTIDLDLVIHGARTGLDPESGIALPDPDLSRWPHLSVPVAELEPGLVLPGERRALREVADEHLAAGGIGRVAEPDLRLAAGLDRSAGRR
jgi:2-amino-4-hydroxy-6-hydroxymethyldihydropteridine diphosphokinase